MKSEEIRINHRRRAMVILDVCLDNFFAFKGFHWNLTYPKKIVGSSIPDEHLYGRPNFRYKKVNIIMGGNATGKTTFGIMIRNIFNFLEKKNPSFITDAITNRENEASFSLDLASDLEENDAMFYRVLCVVSPCADGNYPLEAIRLEIRKQKIRAKDSYESCVKRLEEKPYKPKENYIVELEKIGSLDWFFEYPKDTTRALRFPKNQKYFINILGVILKALDPAIESVEKSQDVENAYVIRLHGNTPIILQDGEQFTTELLSSGTKAGVEIARVVSSAFHNAYTFYYCDEKFSYIHSDLEKAILSLMISYIKPGFQLFFTTHNTDILDMNLPKHSFTFFRKDANDEDCPITCVDAAAYLKRNTDSLKNAVENDLFACAPSIDLILSIVDIGR